MTPTQYKRERKRIWEDLTGCECTRTILVNGQPVLLGRDEMCTRDAIRCNGRANRWQRDLAVLEKRRAAESSGADAVRGKGE